MGGNKHAHVRKQRQNPPPMSSGWCPRVGPAQKQYHVEYLVGKPQRDLNSFEMWCVCDKPRKILLISDTVRGFGAHSGVQPQKIKKLKKLRVTLLLQSHLAQKIEDHTRFWFTAVHKVSTGRIHLHCLVRFPPPSVCTPPYPGSSWEDCGWTKKLERLNFTA